ncbi:MAG TPA: hypothetical protein VFO62_01945, partial [Candidatus Binatia bacterium]|nr:hypothetical protein [Candidatus Binatia bacterium]
MVDESVSARRVIATLAVSVSLQGCVTPLELWHSRRLTEEFTAADAKKVDRFEDYLALEDRLFAE